MLPKERPSDPQLAKPNEKEIEKTTEKTRQALKNLVQKKTSAAQPVRAAEKQAPAQYIRYTPCSISINYTCIIVDMATSFSS